MENKWSKVKIRMAAFPIYVVNWCKRSRWPKSGKMMTTKSIVVGGILKSDKKLEKHLLDEYTDSLRHVGL